jgi:hypothetical protein
VSARVTDVAHWLGEVDEDDVKRIQVGAQVRTH